MSSPAHCTIAALSPSQIAGLRLLAMFAVLIFALTAGYLAHARRTLSENAARKIMTLVLVSFNWVIALLVIWRTDLTPELFWLPVVGLVLMLAMTAVSAAVFKIPSVSHKSHLTLTLAGGLSNHGYTGAAFVCYALFGTAGLALANLYVVLWVPAAVCIFLPYLKFREMRHTDPAARFTPANFLDARMLAIPGIAAAITLNLAQVPYPEFVFTFHIIDVLVYTASGLAFFAIGLRVRLARLGNYKTLYLLLAAVKFAATPLVAFFLLYLLDAAGYPLPKLAKSVIITMSVAPTAVFMVTVSNVFNLDATLASALWVVNTATFVALVAPLLFFLFS